MSSAREALHMSVTNEWYTPSIYIEAARNLMGSIDLDPASCIKANKNVKATTIFTKDDDGIEKDWFGNVWMNPPYGRGGQALWTSKLLSEYRSGRVEQAIVLCNAATDTKWFEELWEFPICFVKKRIKFLSADDSAKHSPTHANVLIYLGRKPIEDFKFHFGIFGPIAVRA